MRDNGKEDTPRPLGVPMEVFDRNFESIFGKKKQVTIEEVADGVVIIEVKDKKENADSRQQSPSVPN